jgi:hypothetical protein
MAEIRRKLVIVGDGACGKTCLLMCVSLPQLDQSSGMLSQTFKQLITAPRSVFSKGTFPEVWISHLRPACNPGSASWHLRYRSRIAFIDPRELDLHVNS